LETALLHVGPEFSGMFLYVLELYPDFFGADADKSLDVLEGVVDVPETV
jgi:hypothetical protein